jgi:YHS domain-containing protein
MDELSIAPIAKDPVAGMEVDPREATAKGLVAEHRGETYYFCGKGWRPRQVPGTC